MSKRGKSTDLVTVKVKRHVKNAILELQALLQLKRHKRFSHSDIIEYALTCIPELQVPLPSSIKIIEENAKNRRQKS